MNLWLLGRFSRKMKLNVRILPIPVGSPVFVKWAVFNLEDSDWKDYDSAVM